MKTLDNKNLLILSSSSHHHCWATGWMNGGSSPGGGCVLFFLFVTASGPTLGPTQFPIQWVPGALYQMLKRPGREDDQSPPSSVEVKNEWNCTSITTIRLHGMALC
jgi:hypothetical protein